MIPEELRSLLDAFQNHEIESLDPNFIQGQKNDILLLALMKGMKAVVDTIIEETVSSCRSETDDIVAREHAKMVNNQDYFNLVKEEVACRGGISDDTILTPYPPDLTKEHAVNLNK